MSNSIGARIKIVRKNFNLTQEELGKLLGVQNAAISKMETDRVVPTDASIKLICATYHVNYLWLTQGVGEMLEKIDTDALVDKYMAGESEWAKSVMKSFAKLPDEEWYKFRDLIEKIKKEGHP